MRKTMKGTLDNLYAALDSELKRTVPNADVTLQRISNLRPIAEHTVESANDRPKNRKEGYYECDYRSSRSDPEATKRPESKGRLWEACSRLTGMLKDVVPDIIESPRGSASRCENRGISCLQGSAITHLTTGAALQKTRTPDIVIGTDDDGVTHQQFNQMMSAPERARGKPYLSGSCGRIARRGS